MKIKTIYNSVLKGFTPEGSDLNLGIKVFNSLLLYHYPYLFQVVSLLSSKEVLIIVTGQDSMQ